MGLIDERILEQMRMAGKPRTSTVKQTSNTTQTGPPESLNLMGMGTLLTMLLNMIDQRNMMNDLSGNNNKSPLSNFTDLLASGSGEAANTGVNAGSSWTTWPIDTLLKMYMGSSAPKVGAGASAYGNPQW